MPLRNGIPLKFKPRGVCDTWDGMNSPPGAMSQLVNLIPDPTTPMAFQCRPAASLVVDFSTKGFSSPGFISIAVEINDRAYGLIATSRTAGCDEPFSYNLLNNTFDTISGITGANVPTSPASTGEWTTPSATVMGPFIVFTHPGFNGSGNGYFGWLDVTTPTAPVWHSGNTATNGLPAVPTFVQLFSNRLYFAVKNALWFTDTLAITISNASQQLTAGDSSMITALSLFTLSTTNQGILQGLLAFKANTVFQVTGDAALSTLAINSLNTAAGTIAPNSVVPTPNGVFFMASDGIRIVNADGSVTEPDTDLRLPFISALYNSRVNASYNSDVYRICVQNTSKANNPWEEYWYDMQRGIWTGPHTFQQDWAPAWKAGFLLFSHLIPGKMFLSYVTQVTGVGFTENGSALSWIFATSPIAEDDSMFINTVNETTINLAFMSGSPAVTCTATDESKGVLAVGTIQPTGSSTVWGGFNWGSGLWSGVQYGMRPHLIPWTTPLVFTKMIFQATAASSLGFKISNLRFLLQPGGYYPNP